jgi:FkbM family methyltransferase
MIKKLYLRCLRYPGLRKPLRLVRAKIQAVAGYSDPFYELARLAYQSHARLFLDIGCHHGETLLRFIESGVSCPAAAFDPSKDNLDRAKKLLCRYPQISFYQTALSDRDGSATFYMNRNEQTSSLLPNDKGNQESFASDTTRLGSCRVETMTLDRWAADNEITGSCIVKCDTQGAEGLVIEGGKNFIREHCVAFYGEVMLGDMYKGQSSFEDIRRLLEKECGMILKNVYPCLHDNAGRAVQMDALWVRF